MQERIQFVDDNDNPIGSGTREYAREHGINHRTALIVLRDEQGRILLQQRSSTKKQWPNCWTTAASGHVDEGESYETAAHREMFEEIGVKTELQLLGTFHLTTTTGELPFTKFSSVFTGTIPASTHFRLSKDEVALVAWKDLSEVKASAKANPGMYTPSVLELLEKFF